MVVSWIEIRNYYVALVDGSAPLDSMLLLVSEIERSRFAQGLYAWTSMCDLCIVQTPVSYPYHGPYLRISPRSDGKLEFRYVDTYNESKQWHRTVEGRDGFSRLERFIDQLHWFRAQ
jgi:hypothetical protein